MAKKVVGYRVIVEPRKLGNLGIAHFSDGMIEPDETKRLELYKRRCEDIASQVKRHVDDIGQVYVEEETETIEEDDGS